MKVSGMNLDGLNTEQQNAVTRTEGPVLILAGAGSGKTRVLTHRIAWMLEQRVCRPWQILALTFTNKAAREMKDRIAQLVGERVDEMWVGTFHSIFARILRREAELLGYDRNYSIYDSDDQLRLLKDIMKRREISTNQLNPKRVRSVISSAKNAMLDPESFANSDSGYLHELYTDIFRDYSAGLKKANAMDFDDLLLLPIELFRKFPERLHYWRDRFRHVMIDEYQDTNRAQFTVTQMLAEEHNNICVVGDDDQSIYGWRGADISNILDFEDHWPQTAVFKLEQNYRSSETILETAHSIVSHNAGRKPKKLWTDKGKGELVTLLAGEDEAMEAALICDRIQQANRAGQGYGDFAVLYRTNAQSRALEEALIRNGVRYQIIGGLRFYERREVKDLLAYLRLLVNPRDTISLLRVINYPKRGLGDVAVGRIRQLAVEENLDFYDALPVAAQRLSGAAGQRAGELHALLEELRGRLQEESADAVMQELMDRIRLLEHLEAEGPEGQPRIENVRELQSALARYSDNSELGLEGFLQEVALVADVDGLQDAGDQVTLMTVHSAKGLEFDTVFVSGLEEGLFPLGNSFADEDDLEEERRLFYVAATRAERKLYLSMARYRRRYGGGGGGPSPFLSQLPPELLDQADDFGGGRFRGRDERAGGRDGRWQGGGETRETIRRPGRPASRPKRSGRVPLSGSEALLNKVSPFRDGAPAADPMPDYENESQEFEGPSDPREIHVRAVVLHSKYGRGIVIHKAGFDEDMRITVRFDSVGVKKLVARFAKLQVVG